MFGVLPVDKSAGKTSRDIVNQVQRVLKPLKIKVGHTGTLDPMATGVLLIAVGHATRLMEFSHRSEKEYCGTFEAGKTSDSLDTEGEVRTLDEAKEFSQADLEAALPRFTGLIEQVPPKYSAIHVDGKRAYELARQGKDFEVPSRQVTIHRVSLTEFGYPRFSLQICCSSGTYIRTLGSDIARSCGSDAVMSDLRRTRIGSVSVENCLSLEKLDSKEAVERALLAPHVLLDQLAKCTLAEDSATRIRNGIRLERSDLLGLSDLAEDPIAAFDAEKSLVAILEKHSSGSYRSLRVFQNT
ncbi:MAG: tRNA pseudouridine(55) synthase TruB [Planctomycetota bacterium]